MRSSVVGQTLLYGISIFASIGVFLFGYDQGVMSGLITGPEFQAFFDKPDAVALGTMVAVLEIGALVTSLAAGLIGDKIGRKRTLFSGAVLFTLGGAIQTFTVGYKSMIAGRFISGFGVGLLSYVLVLFCIAPRKTVEYRTIVPIYQSEVSPPSHRGALACMEFSGNIFGYLSSVWIDYGCSFIDSDWSWRFPLAVQCFIGAILAAGSLFLPESPRWLIDSDRDKEGMRVIADLHGGDLNDPLAKLEFKEIKDNVTFEHRTSQERTYTLMWQRYRLRVLLAMSSQAFAQLNGINVISYYAPRVFEEAGWHGRDAILMTGINAIIYLLSTIPTWYLVDRWGRRVILLSGSIVMSFALAATAWWLWINVEQTPQAVVLCVILFNAAFGFSWGPIPWLYPAEIMPLAFRAKGVSLATATNWAFNYIVGELTPIFQELIGWRLYLMHSFSCVCSFFLVYFLYPETMGVPLEEMDRVFNEVKSKVSQLEGQPEEVALVQRHASSSALNLGDTHGEYSSNNRWWPDISRTDSSHSRKDYMPINNVGED